MVQIEAGHLVVALTALAGGLGTMVWWFIRRIDSRVDSERSERDEWMKEERKIRDEDRHTLRNEISAVSNRVTQHELKVAREYATTSDLTHAMGAALKPVESALARLERAVERVFEALDNKQDKHMGGG